MNIRRIAGTAVVAVGALVALSTAQQQPQQPSQARATQRSTIVVYKSPT